MWIRIRIQLLFKVIGICNQTLQASIESVHALHGSILSLQNF
jgi:hypothetical protein